MITYFEPIFLCYILIFLFIYCFKYLRLVKENIKKMVKPKDTTFVNYIILLKRNNKYKKNN